MPQERSGSGAADGSWMGVMPRSSHVHPARVGSEASVSMAVWVVVVSMMSFPFRFLPQRTQSSQRWIVNGLVGGTLGEDGGDFGVGEGEAGAGGGEGGGELRVVFAEVLGNAPTAKRVGCLSA